MNKHYLRKFRIGIDQDGVMLDLLEGWLDWYNHIWDDNLTKEDITEWDISNFVKPGCGKRVFDILNRSSLYKTLKPIPNSESAIEQLSLMGHELFMVTSATHSQSPFNAKFDMCEKYFPCISYKKRMFVGDKSGFLGDILIDDGIHNLEGFTGMGILFDAPHNQSNNKFYRVKGWKEILELAQKDFQPLIDFYKESGSNVEKKC